jgi:hypothetical protein
VNVLETQKIAKKNDTQTKQGEEMLPYFPPKPQFVGLVQKMVLGQHICTTCDG